MQISRNPKPCHTKHKQLITRKNLEKAFEIFSVQASKSIKSPIPRTCFAVSLSFGSGSNICLTKSLALSETLGQGSRLKSIFPRRIACATPCSVSAIHSKDSLFKKKIRFICKRTVRNLVNRS